MTQSEWNKAKQKTLTEDERLDAVWETLVRRVAVDPSIFHSVVEILRNEPALEKLGDHMKGLSQSLETSRACSDSFFCFVKAKHGRYQFCSIPNSYSQKYLGITIDGITKYQCLKIFLKLFGLPRSIWTPVVIAPPVLNLL